MNRIAVKNINGKVVHVDRIPDLWKAAEVFWEMDNKADKQRGDDIAESWGELHALVYRLKTAELARPELFAELFRDNLRIEDY